MKHNDQAETQTRRKEKKVSVFHRFFAIIYSPFPSAYRFRMFHWQSMENMLDVTDYATTFFSPSFILLRSRCLIEEEKERKNEWARRESCNISSLETSSLRLFLSATDSMIYAGNKSININTHVAIVITKRESTVAFLVENSVKNCMESSLRN